MQKINIVWLKRELRLSDHPPLYEAQSSDYPCLLLYLFEPDLLNDDHYDLRHWRFVYQSLQDINAQLAGVNSHVIIKIASAKDAFSELQQCFDIQGVYSHQEIGLAVTYQRDKQMADWFQQQAIPWYETPSGAVIRGASSRDSWDKHWKQVMRAPVLDCSLVEEKFVSATELQPVVSSSIPKEWTEPCDTMQHGGASKAADVLQSFFSHRGKAYYYSISKPQASRQACSRLSPYLAWGNLSLREVYQTLLSHWNTPGMRRSLAALSSRLHWHCHFIQKFESESEMEFRPVNRAYRHLAYENDLAKLTAWEQGKTGYPLVDACMRCLIDTGYINFRMRAMLVSFLTHHLNIDWQLGVKHLARLFLDFEPGIHYTQFQMQASVTGTNTIRIYNPTKQAQDHDPDGEFIHQWLPELTHIPAPMLFEPWNLTPMEAQMYQLSADSVYLAPIILLQQSEKQARDRLWRFRKREDVKVEAKRILARHVRPD